MTDINSDIKKLLLALQGKNVFLITKSKLHYRTNNLMVIDDSISFTDKFGSRVMISISEIAQVSEVLR